MLIYVADSTILYSSVCKTNVPVYECIATDWILIGNVREECICSSDQINFLHALLKKCKTFFFSQTHRKSCSSNTWAYGISCQDSIILATNNNLRIDANTNINITYMLSVLFK